MELIKKYSISAFSAFFLSLSLLQSCQTAHKATASGAAVKAAVCAETWLSFPEQPHPMWQEVKSSQTTFPAGFTAPYKYKLYQVNQDTLQAFFSAFRQRSEQGMVIPVGKSCEPLLMRRSGTMSQALQEKYPDIISLQGNGTVNKAAELRLDWDGKQLKGQLSHNESIYYITPVNTGEGLRYMIYDRKETAETKQPFEVVPHKEIQKTESARKLEDR